MPGDLPFLLLLLSCRGTFPAVKRQDPFFFRLKIFENEKNSLTASIHLHISPTPSLISPEAQRKTSSNIVGRHPSSSLTDRFVALVYSQGTTFTRRFREMLLYVVGCPKTALNSLEEYFLPTRVASYIEPCDECSISREGMLLLQVCKGDLE